MTEYSLTTLIGGEIERTCGKWWTFVDGKDRFLYGIPCDARRVVKFNPLDRRLFAKDAAEECDATFYDSAVRKFGIEKVFQLIKECLPTDEEWSDAHSNALPLFMVADSSCENCAASVIYDFLRRNAHALLANYSDEDSKIIQNRKCKVGGH